MKKSDPYLQIFEFSDNAPDGSPGSWAITSVVVDMQDFEKALELLLKSRVLTANLGSRLDDETYKQIKEAGHIPMIARGTITQPVFDLFNVQTKFMGLILRGTAQRMMSDSMDLN